MLIILSFNAYNMSNKKLQIEQLETRIRLIFSHLVSDKNYPSIYQDDQNRYETECSYPVHIGQVIPDLKLP